MKAYRDEELYGWFLSHQLAPVSSSVEKLGWGLVKKKVEIDVE